jgi:hypothetical protein
MSKKCIKTEIIFVICCGIYYPYHHHNEISSAFVVIEVEVVL